MYFYDVSLLKIVTSLLTRKYQNNDTHIAAVKDFLFYVSASLGKQLLEYGEVSFFVNCLISTNKLRSMSLRSYSYFLTHGSHSI